MGQSAFSGQWCTCCGKWLGHQGVCLQMVLVSWYGNELLHVLVHCTATYLCEFQGDFPVAQSPLVAGISGICKLSSGLHLETCNLL